MDFILGGGNKENKANNRNSNPSKSTNNVRTDQLERENVALQREKKLLGTFCLSHYANF